MSGKCEGMVVLMSVWRDWLKRDDWGGMSQRERPGIFGGILRFGSEMVEGLETRLVFG